MLLGCLCYIGHIVSDNVDDMGFTKLKSTLIEDFKQKFDEIDVNYFCKLVTRQEFENDRDLSSHISLYFANLCKNYGHPILNPIDGIKKLRNNAKKHIDVDDQLAKKVLWKFRETYTINFFKKNGRSPNLEIIGELKSV